MADVTVRVCGLTDVGRKRKNNEDAWVVSDLAGGELSTNPTTAQTLEVGERGVLLAVSDGMGGARAGEVASALVVDSLEKALEKTARTEGSGVTSIMEAAVEQANQEVWQAAHDEEKAGMGATLTAVLITQGLAHIAEVGDSRAYLIRGRTIRQVTRDQSYAQQLIDAGVLRPDDVGRFPMKNMVLQAMGQRENVSVEIGRLELRRGDRLVLCSDGLHGKVKDEEIKFAVLGAKQPEDACRKLIALANDRGGDDNITVVIAQVDGAGLPGNVEGERVTQTYQVVAQFDPSTVTLEEDPSDAFDSGNRRRITPEQATDTKPVSGSLLPAMLVLLLITAIGTYFLIR